MAELGLDGALVAVVHRDRGGVAAAQAVPGIAGGVQSCRFGGTLDDQGDRAVGQAVQPMVPARLTGRNSGPWTMPAWSSQARIAATGQVSG